MSSKLTLTPLAQYKRNEVNCNLTPGGGGGGGGGGGAGGGGGL